MNFFVQYVGFVEKGVREDNMRYNLEVAIETTASLS